MERLEVELCARLHTGEIQPDGDDVSGIAVAIGARIGAMAAPGEVLVSSTVKDLVVGSGLTLENRGTDQLKGVQDAWHLYALGQRNGPGGGDDKRANRASGTRLVDTAKMISTVAVGTDGSATADEAVRHAAEIARRFDAKLVLLSAFRNPKGSSASRRGDDIELQWASNPSARVRSILERSEADLRRSGLECETRADEGDPGEVLVRLASECGADLLVIGNRGMKRRVLGSVPNTVTHKADCSVLVVKTS